MWIVASHPLEPLETGAPHGYDEPSSPADDRGHDDPQLLAGDSAILLLCGRAVQPTFPLSAGPARHGGRPRLPAASHRRTLFLDARQPSRLRSAVLLWRHARPAGGGGADRLRPRAGEVAAGPRPRGGRAPACGGGGTAQPRRVDDGVRGRAARRRGRATEGRRDRQSAHAHSYRERQGRQGALRHAVAAAPRNSARLLATDALQRLAVSRPGTPADTSAEAPCRTPAGGRGAAPGSTSL